jgi:hypothetical protein
MKRYFLELPRAYIDAENMTKAREQAQALLQLREADIPQKAIIKCSVTPSPNSNNQYSARAYFNGELIASCDAASQERALLALGLNSPKSHTCRIYDQRFGSGNYQLELDNV